MEINEIRIKIDNDLVCLCGNEYGYDVFEKQLKDKIDYSKKNVIIFPENITDIAISFIQGLMREPIKKIGKKNIFDYFEFKASSSALEKDIKESVVFQVKYNFIINDFEINNKYSTQKIKKLIFDFKKNMMIEKYINEDDFNLLKKYLIDIDETVIILKDKCKSKDTQYMKEKIGHLQCIVKKLFVFIKKKYF